jgi:hypothetical protein
LDLSKGKVVLSFPKPGAFRKKNAPPPEDVLVMPLGEFLTVFRDPQEFHKKLTKKAEEVAQEWLDVNGSKEMVKKRVTVEKRFCLFRYFYFSEGGEEEISEVELWLNTYKFTNDNNQRNVPDQMKMGDIRVSKQ